MPTEGNTSGLDDLLTRIWSNENLASLVNAPSTVTAQQFRLQPAHVPDLEQMVKDLEDLKKRVAELEAAQAPGVRFLQKQKPQ